MQSICVFCGSRPGNDPIYKETANALANMLAAESIALVYGGGKVGLMGAMADRMLLQGGKVVGVIPISLKEKEVAHTGLTELLTVQTMHERKKIMYDRSDGFIVLPGGFGTLDEFFEILTWAQLGIHHKPISILNLDGYFDPLLAMIDQMIEKGFVAQTYRHLFLVAHNLEKVLEPMRTYDFKGPDKAADALIISDT